jgi:hypothetical protein
MQRQARAPETQPFGAEAFEASDGTVLRWLGMAGFLINSRGTTVMVDPLLGGFDMPVMIEFPIPPPTCRSWTPCSSRTATTTTTACPPVVIWLG